jgi:small subunit ribosomal protein S13
MIQLFNKNYDNNVIIVKLLQEIFGIGFSKAKYLCFKCGLNLKTKIGDINDHIFRIILKELKQNSIVDNDLKKNIQENIKIKKNINCYQGFRHLKNLPVRGQRTHSNGKTKKRIKN